MRSRKPELAALYTSHAPRVQRLLRQLVAANCGLISFAEKEPTLEDVFMMVTKGLVT